MYTTIAGMMIPVIIFSHLLSSANIRNIFKLCAFCVFFVLFFQQYRSIFSTKVIHILRHDSGLSLGMKLNTETLWPSMRKRRRTLKPLWNFSTLIFFDSGKAAVK